eukprot:12840996-Alexandrium_andersonii.AAC.1
MSQFNLRSRLVALYTQQAALRRRHGAEHSAPRTHTDHQSKFVVQDRRGNFGEAGSARQFRGA